MILNWTHSPDLEALRSISSYTERRQRLDAFYDALKKPLLRDFEQFPGVTITNALEGTGQAIVVAKAETWRSLLNLQNSPFENKEIEVQFNDKVYAMS
ncbi:unnamed protein product [Pararhodospirillum photometricum DSM 122]|uniref:Uncharacterized protein n=1 Tax=Pararhodospirillum photometricum DSM 122 TaxID=1150469 RepID=H6SNQ2_PARPM|nr:unnamed protein product [Pararhodospirillum photometricum DSM 122]